MLYLLAFISLVLAGKDCTQVKKQEFVPHCGKCMYDEQCIGWQATREAALKVNRPSFAYCCPNLKRCLQADPENPDNRRYELMRCPGPDGYPEGDDRKMADCQDYMTETIGQASWRGNRDVPGCSDRSKDYPTGCKCGNQDWPDNWATGCDDVEDTTTAPPPVPTPEGGLTCTTCDTSDRWQVFPVGTRVCQFSQDSNGCVKEFPQCEIYTGFEMKCTVRDATEAPAVVSTASSTKTEAPAVETSEAPKKETTELPKTETTEKQTEPPKKVDSEEEEEESDGGEEEESDGGEEEMTCEMCAVGFVAQGGCSLWKNEAGAEQLMKKVPEGCDPAECEKEMFNQCTACEVCAEGFAAAGGCEASMRVDVTEQEISGMLPSGCSGELCWQTIGGLCISNQECKDKVDDLRAVLYDDEATCATAIESYGDTICSNDLFSPYCCATCKSQSESAEPSESEEPEESAEEPEESAEPSESEEPEESAESAEPSESEEPEESAEAPAVVSTASSGNTEAPAVETSEEPEESAEPSESEEPEESAEDPEDSILTMSPAVLNNVESDQEDVILDDESAEPSESEEPEESAEAPAVVSTASSANTEAPAVETSGAPAVVSTASSGNTEAPAVETSETPAVVSTASSSNTEAPAVETSGTSSNTEAPAVETSDCVDLPNWGCEGITVAEDCNGLQMKKCQKACGQCEEEEEETTENLCTETFDPVCSACGPDDECDGNKFKIETRGAGQMSRFGCSYPKNYEFVNSGEGCPECTDMTCDWKISGGNTYNEADLTQTGCFGTASHVEGDSDDFDVEVVGDEVTVTKHPNANFLGAVGTFSEADGVKTIKWGDNGPTYTCGGAATVDSCKAMTSPLKFCPTDPPTCVQDCTGGACGAFPGAAFSDTCQPTVDSCKAMTPPHKLCPTDPPTCVEDCTRGACIPFTGAAVSDTCQPVTQGEYCPHLTNYFSCAETSCCRWKNRPPGCQSAGRNTGDHICTDIHPHVTLWVNQVLPKDKAGEVGVRAQFDHRVRIIDQQKLKTTEWKEFAVPHGVTEFWIRYWKSKGKSAANQALLLKSDAQWDVSVVTGPPNPKRSGGKKGGLSAAERTPAWCPEGELGADADEDCANAKHGYFSGPVSKYDTDEYIWLRLITDDDGKPVPADDSFWYGPDEALFFTVWDNSNLVLRLLAVVGFVSVFYILLQLLSRGFSVNDYKPILSQSDVAQAYT